MGDGITYEPRKAIKSQVLADFVAEWMGTQLPPPQIQSECWTLYFDGSLMKTGAGAGLVFISPLGVRMRYAIRLHFPSSNNMEEYEALVNGLHITVELEIKRLDVRGNSRLIIDQVMKESSCHDPKMDAYCKTVRRLEEKFDGLELSHVLRKHNEAADALAKMASERAMVPQMSSSVTSTSLPSTTKITGARVHLRSTQISIPRPPRPLSWRPWTLSPSLPYPTTCRIGATHCCNASLTALCPQIKLRHGV